MLAVDGCLGCSADCAVRRRLRSLNQRANSAVGSSSSSSLQLSSRSEIRSPPASGARPPPVRAVVAPRSRPPALGSGGASEDRGPGLTSCCTSSASRRPEMAWRRCRLISAVGRPGSSALPAGPGAPGPEGPCPGWEGGLTHSSGRLGGGGAAPNIGPRRRAVCAREASRRGRAGCVGRRPRVAVAERGRPTVRRGWPGSSPGAASRPPAPPSPATVSSPGPLRPSRAGSASEAARWLGSAPDAGGAEPAPPAPPPSSRRDSVPVAGATAELARLVVIAIAECFRAQPRQPAGGSAEEATAALVPLRGRRNAAQNPVGWRTKTAPRWGCRAPRRSKRGRAAHIRAATGPRQESLRKARPGSSRAASETNDTNDARTRTIRERYENDS